MNLNNLHMIPACLVCIAACLLIPAEASAAPADSVGVENADGKKVILHKIEPKETYFSLSRRYRISAKDIMDLNKQQQLKVGHIIKIPTGLPYSAMAAQAICPIQMQTVSIAWPIQPTAAIHGIRTARAR